ncbi:pyrroline-5-carboxylate reductase [Pseudomonas sp. CBZ-4]|uniref:pyrroline-5-carboxylate reductase family protein n=1 Tax=Pseudomonas sp. CBZ-4 TaxID=1163065 RepID=UPI0015A5395D|nr:pyrroline-5-carboxylate reductase [Pseudomonas sp. CBZ-4]
MSKTTIEVVIIGAGHMGSAIALGLKRSSLNILITAVDPDLARRNAMTTMEIYTVEDLPNHSTPDLIILAIPPQAFKKMSTKNLNLEQYEGPVISVMAGIHLSELAAKLNTPQLCRAIPNLACAINEGMTALSFHTQITEENIRLIEAIFSSLGKTITIKDETLIDSATALIGGGPAYISYFTAALMEYAISTGFDKDHATSIAIQSLRGTTTLLSTSHNPPMALCEKVMTPEGTTIQAINFFNSMQLRTIIVDGLKRSQDRSIELGKGV